MWMMLGTEAWEESEEEPHTFDFVTSYSKSLGLSASDSKLRICKTEMMPAYFSVWCQEWWPFAILHRFSCNKVKRQDQFPSDMVDFSLLGALWTHLSWEFSALPALRGEHLIAFLDILFRCTLSYIKCCSQAAVMANSALSALAFLNFSLGYSQNPLSTLSSPSFPSSSFLCWERLSQCSLGLLQSQYPPVLAETKLSFENTDLKTPPVFLTLNSFSFCYEQSRDAWWLTDPSMVWPYL